MLKRQAGEAEAPRFLLIDRDPASARALGASLAEAICGPERIVVAGGGRPAIDHLRLDDFAIVLIDLHSLGDISASPEEGVARLVRLAEGALVIVLSDAASVSSAVAAMRAGAHDYLARPLSGAALGDRLAELAERHGKAHALAPSRLASAEAADFAGFIGNSSQMRFVYEQIGRIAPSAAPVFITGESGTGKEVCAKALHSRSPRARRKFVAINCAAIPRDLMESELFGAARGAFTGASAERAGAIETANGGTLFLDEIAEMDLSLQGKLLRFLQTGAVSRIGESGTRALDVRVVCATNRTPMTLIAERLFREDLFYRLHVLPIHLPPLRQRAGDVMVLARHFLHRLAGEEHKHFSGFSPDAAGRLSSQEWPGNVRQLQNLVRRLTVMFDGGEITADMLDLADIEGRGAGAAQETAPERHAAVQPMWVQEQRIIEEAIARFGGNVALAAAALQISPSTIYRKRQVWAETAGAA